MPSLSERQPTLIQPSMKEAEGSHGAVDFDGFRGISAGRNATGAPIYTARRSKLVQFEARQHAFRDE